MHHHTLNPPHPPADQNAGEKKRRKKAFWVLVSPWGFTVEFPFVPLRLICSSPGGCVGWVCWCARRLIVLADAIAIGKNLLLCGEVGNLPSWTLKWKFNEVMGSDPRGRERTQKRNRSLVFPPTSISWCHFIPTSAKVLRFYRVLYL